MMMMIVSMDQRPGWTKHVQSESSFWCSPQSSFLAQDFKEGPQARIQAVAWDPIDLAWLDKNSRVRPKILLLLSDKKVAYAELHQELQPVKHGWCATAVPTIWQEMNAGFRIWGYSLYNSFFAPKAERCGDSWNRPSLAMESLVRSEAAVCANSSELVTDLFRSWDRLD
jgi:hypothetical protein